MPANTRPSLTQNATNSGLASNVTVVSPGFESDLRVQSYVAELGYLGPKAEWRGEVVKVADGHGTVLQREHFAFLTGEKVVSDTRLAPVEGREETFSFAIPPSSQAQVKATFWSYYSPMARIESQKRITFLTLNRLVPAASKR